MIKTKIKFSLKACLRAVIPPPASKPQKIYSVRIPSHKLGVPAAPVLMQQHGGTAPHQTMVTPTHNTSTCIKVFHYSNHHSCFLTLHTNTEQK